MEMVLRFKAAPSFRGVQDGHQEVPRGVSKGCILVDFNGFLGRFQKMSEGFRELNVRSSGVSINLRSFKGI